MRVQFYSRRCIQIYRCYQTKVYYDADRSNWNVYWKAPAELRKTLSSQEDIQETRSSRSFGFKFLALYSSQYIHQFSKSTSNSWLYMYQIFVPYPVFWLQCVYLLKVIWSTWQQDTCLGYTWAREYIIIHDDMFIELLFMVFGSASSKLITWYF